jgi:hypothetical protein
MERSEFDPIEAASETPEVAHTTPAVFDLSAEPDHSTEPTSTNQDEFAEFRDPQPYTGALKDALDNVPRGGLIAPTTDTPEPEAPAPAIVATRVEMFSMYIAEFPDLPVNYLLRGEAYYDDGEEEDAIADFQKALTLAQTRVDTEDWGYIYQSYIDRAREGLRRCGL